MRVLGLDTATSGCSAALWDDGAVTVRRREPMARGQAEALVPLAQAALAELPERTRRAFELHRMDEMTIAAVAAELGLSVSRVWTLIRTAYEHVDARLTDGS